MRAPAGHFYIDSSNAPAVLIGGGIGITPLLSMLNWCVKVQTGREVWLFYGVRRSAELVMQAHLQASNDYSRYTCYGCHEHTPANIRREHIEEGIRQFDNCTECHRSGNKDDIKGGKEGNGDKEQD